ncbi:putative olfactory receptor 52P1 [Dermochelys coriacea]|uniref:putative olfactory receptor 52P1 n=1 Tax=Dermochelys coriacea TaxID=27794 RepID=UPI0018E75530|nr:putative olfactory receptor 52P1 [Dermochelys coriacea]
MGIPGLEAAHFLISIPFSMFYIVGLLGNFTLLFVVWKEKTLHKPMDLLLCMLALTDISMPTSIVPKALCIFWFNFKGITASGSLTQMFFLQAASVMQSAVLVTIAFNRYVAICNHLRYATILTDAQIAKLGLMGLARAVLFLLPLSLLRSRLPFCANRIIPHTYCDHMAVVKMSCGDITVNRTYGLIIRTVLRISSKKALNICIAHIGVILVSYTPFLFSSQFGQGIALHVHIILANLYFLLAATLNPIIYGVIMKKLCDKVGKYTCTM